MPIGDIIWQTLKVGQLDLINSEASIHGVDIYEDITDPFGHPLAEINVVDPIDALNKYKITGSYDENEIEIKFKYEPTGELVGFKFKVNSVKSLMDRMGDRDESSGKMKQYQIRGMQAEYFKSQGKRVQKTYSGPTTKHVEDIWKEISDKQITTEVPSEPRVKTIATKFAPDAVQELIADHSAPNSKSCAYVVFQKWQNCQVKIIQTTYDKLLSQQPVVKLRERTDLNTSGITEQDQQNSIMFGEYDPSWSEPRALGGGKIAKCSFNLATHSVTSAGNQKQQTSTDKPAFKEVTYAEYIPDYTAHDAMNNSTKETSAEASRKRLQYLSHLMQGEATIEIAGNPKITLGSVIELDIPKKTDDNASGGEGQMNRKALVVAIRHKIKPAGQNPRYTMVLELVKGGMEQGGTTG